MANYKLTDLYSTRHEELMAALKDAGYPGSGAARTLVDDARILVSAGGFEVDKYKVCETLRKQVSAGEKKSVAAIDTMFGAARLSPAPKSGSAVVGNDVIRRVAAMETLRHLSDGLKLIAAGIRSTFLLVSDMPLDRGVAGRQNVNAFVFSDEKIDIIYVEPAFFSEQDMFKYLKNWTRIVVHELSHRKAKTKDHRYRHYRNGGLKPDAADPKFTAAQALANADSWAMFCMDCAGAMVKGDYVKVQVGTMHRMSEPP